MATDASLKVTACTESMEQLWCQLVSNTNFKIISVGIVRNSELTKMSGFMKVEGKKKDSFLNGLLHGEC